MYLYGHVIVVVCFFFLALDQWPLPVLQLSCNYTTVCDVWVFKRSNTVSIPSQGTDLRKVSRRYKRSLAVFWCHTIVFFFFCPCVFLFSFVLLSWVGFEPVKCHLHSEVIIEQRIADGIGQGGETSMRPSKQERKKRKEWKSCKNEYKKQ